MIAGLLLTCVLIVPAQCGTVKSYDVVDGKEAVVKCRTAEGNLRRYRMDLAPDVKPDKLDVVINNSRHQLDALSIDCMREGW